MAHMGFHTLEMAYPPYLALGRLVFRFAGLVMLAFSSKPNLTLVDQSLLRQRSYICRGRESPLQVYGIEKIALDQVERLG